MKVLLDYHKRLELNKAYLHRIEMYFNKPGELFTVYGILKAFNPEVIANTASLSQLDYYLIALPPGSSVRAAYGWATEKVANGTHSFHPTGTHPNGVTDIREMTVLTNNACPCIWLPALFMHQASNRYIKHVLQNAED